MTDPTFTDWRALCAELVDNLERYQSWYIEDNGYGIDDLEALLRRTQAALAQPEPQGPTDEELGKLLYYEFTTSTGHGERVDAMGFARAVLARWGNQ